MVKSPHQSRVLFLASLAQLLLVAVGAFHSTPVAKPLTSKNVVATKAKPFSSQWSPLEVTDSGNENAFSKTAQPTSSSLFSFQIRSIFRSPSTEATKATTTTTSTTKPRSSTSSSISGNDLNVPVVASTTIQATSKALAQATVSGAIQKVKNVAESVGNVRVHVPVLQPQQWMDQLVQFVLEYWWCVPTFLALVPLYTTFVLNIGDAAMPHWWPVTRMDHILKAPDASMVLSVFLGSNIAFFVGGAYLVQKFPARRTTTTTTTTSNEAVASTTATTTNSAALVIKNFVKSCFYSMRLIPTRQTWLGLLLLASGLISTIFHTEQALGSFAMANSLCYLDHAVAGTSTFYFFHTCGRPSKRVGILMVAGLAALSIVPPHPLPGYAWLHSAWHFIAAGAAVLWAVESHGCTSGQQNNNDAQKSLSSSPVQVTSTTKDD